MYPAFKNNGDILQEYRLRMKPYDLGQTTFCVVSAVLHIRGIKRAAAVEE